MALYLEDPAFDALHIRIRDQVGQSATHCVCIRTDIHAYVCTYIPTYTYILTYVPHHEQQAQALSNNLT
jgi:hypothetical protein